jgi:hypothetical protein
MSNAQLRSSRFCTKCGERLSNDVKFCPKCGQPVDNAFAKTWGEDGSPGIQSVTSAAPAKKSWRRSVGLGCGCLTLFLILIIPAFVRAGRREQEKRKQAAQNYERSTRSIEKTLNNMGAIADKEEARLLDVEYVIRTNPKQLVSVTYTNAEGGTEQANKITVDQVEAGHPEAARWVKKFKAPRGTSLSISVQNEQNHGIIFLKIFVEGQEVRESTAEGAYASANCNFDVPHY